MNSKQVKLSLAYNEGYRAVKRVTFRLDSSVTWSAQRLITAIGTDQTTCNEISQLTGLKYKTVYRLLTRMANVGIIAKIGKSEYRLSPDGLMAYNALDTAIQPALKAYRESIIEELASKGLLK